MRSVLDLLLLLFSLWHQVNQCDSLWTLSAFSLKNQSVTGCQHYRSVWEIEQTWINKGQNCQQEECLVACEDLHLNSIWKAKSSSRTEPKAPGQPRDFLRIISNKHLLLNNFRTFPFLFLSILKCSKPSQIPEWPKVSQWGKWQFWPSPHVCL